MPLVAPRSVRDRFQHVLHSVIPKLNGDAALEPTNYEENWGFFEVDEDGDPDGFHIGLPPAPTGFWVFVSAVNGGPQTRAAQNTAPIPMSDDSYLVQNGWVEGHSPRSHGVAGVAPPQAFEAKAVPTSQLGFRAGTYWLSYTWIDALGRHTTLATPTTVVVGEGQYIRVTLPTSPPKGAVALGLWLSEPGGDLLTLRLQDVVQYITVIPPTHLMKGPYRRQAPAPTTNQTTQTVPRTPSLIKVRGNGASREGVYRARVYRVNRAAATVSRPSDWSEELDLTSTDAEDHVHVLVDWRDWGAAMDKDKKADVSYVVEVEATDDGVTQNYFLSQPDDPLSSAELNSRRHTTPTFSGVTEEETERQPLLADGSTLVQLKQLMQTYGLTTGEDGLESPSAPLSDAVPENRVGLAPGDYWVSIAYAVGDEETAATDPVKVTITAGQGIRVWFPDPVNYFRNSQFRDIDAGAVLDGWTITGATGTGPGDGTIGSYYFDTEGRLNLSSVGSKTGANLTPDLSQAVSVNRNSPYVMGGKIQVSVSAGTVDVLAEELDGTGSIINTYTLASIATSGEETFQKVFGPGFQAMNANTGQLRMRIKMTGATRNALVTIEELYFHPHTRRLRRRLFAPLFSRLPDTPEVDAFVRWFKTALKGVELPPTGASVNTAPSATSFQDVVDFEGNALPSPWALRQSSATSTVAQVQTAAAIDGTYGYRFEKNGINTSYLYLYRNYATTRTAMALRSRVRVRALPSAFGSTTYVGIMAVKSGQADGSTADLAELLLFSDGSLWLMTVDDAGNFAFQVVASGVALSDLLDLEIRISGAGSNAGKAEAYFAKGGGSRVLAATINNVDWSSRTPSTVQLGGSDYYWTGSTWKLDFDGIAVSERGYVPPPPPPPSLHPFVLPDRPTLPVVTEEVVNFETNLIPGTWVQHRTPTSNTTLAVQAASAIGGSYGLRVADANTATVADVYISRALSGNPQSKGFRARIRVVQLPSTAGASVRLMAIRGTGGVILGKVYLTSAGDVYAQTTTGGGTDLAAIKIASGIANGNVLTLEMVAQNAHTQAGTMSYWISVGGTGAASQRSLLWIDSNVDWGTVYLSELDVGAFGESVASNTTTLDVDEIAVTARGEIVMSEYAEDARAIHQAHVYFPQGQPFSDDLYLRGWRKAVKPGRSYEAGIRHRHEGVWTTETGAAVNYVAQPYFFTAYDTKGRAHPLGGLLNDGDGATGTQAWDDHRRVFEIPDDCYEVRMDSRNIGPGEFVCQEFMWGPEGSAQREVYYPASGTLYAVLDTDVPEKWEVGGVVMNNEWLSAAVLLDLPTGTSVVQQWHASDSDDPPYDPEGGPSPWRASPELLTPARFLHARFTLNADPSLRKTPTVKAGSPFVNSYSALHGQQAAAFLRADLSEFSGGCWALGDILFPRFLAEYDTRQPRGRVFHHRTTDRVGRLPGFTLRAYSEDAIVEIEETWTEDKVIEYRDRRVVVRLVSPPEFSNADDYPPIRLSDGRYVGMFEAAVEEVEVVSVTSMVAAV